MDCKLRLGQRVKVINTDYASEWPETCIVVLLEWRYQIAALAGRPREVNVGIATADQIEARHGITDGWSPDDLEALD